MRRALQIVGGAVVIGLGGAAVVASGVIPIRASSGHWAITAWFLHTVMQRSVATHSMRIEPPPLTDPGLARLGANAYETSCASCHGAPGRPMPVVPAQMTPHPPELSGSVGDYDPEDLFYIVKHGVKFTGMPAWPALHRDDEVWAVVAFLREMPALEPAAYEALVAAPIDDRAPEVVAERCARCHGLDGLGFDEEVLPQLAGQRVVYLEASLDAYAAGLRHSGVMQPIAASLDEASREAAARYYAELAPGGPIGPVDAQAAARGERIALEGGPDGRAARCAHCHGPKEGPRHALYPDLAGQRAAYLAQQLRLFQAGHRGGTGMANVMHTVASHALEPDQIGDVAAYYASLRPEGSP